MHLKILDKAQRKNSKSQILSLLITISVNFSDNTTNNKAPTHHSPRNQRP